MSVPTNIAIGETWQSATMIAVADGSAIVTGTVNMYLIALTGANAGKWYRESDSSWQAAETANAMTYQGGAEWTITWGTSPFADGIYYQWYAEESGGLEVPQGGTLLAKTLASPRDEMDLVNAPNATAITAIQSGLSTFDPASNAVARVTLVDTTTTNTDMRGTDGANTVAPATPTDVTDAQAAIEAYGDIHWATATGFATPTNVSDGFSAIQGAGSHTIGEVYTAAASAATAAGNAQTAAEAAASSADVDAAVSAIEDYGDANGWNSSGGLDAAGIRDAIGMASANLDTQLSGISAGTGNGAYARTITVTNDAAEAIQGATVRATAVGKETCTGTTNASGQVSFSCDIATWTVSITATGYTFTPTTLDVSGDGSTTYVMTTVSVSASDNPAKCVISTTALVDGAASAGVVYYYRLAKGDGTAGYSPDSTVFSVTSGTAGLTTFALLKGKEYYIRRGTGKEYLVLVPDTDTATLEELIGTP